MSVFATNKIATGSNVDATNYNTASLTPVANRLYLLWVYTIAAAAPNTPTATGGGLTWTQVDTKVEGLRRGTLFRALSASPGAGAAINIDFGGQTQTGAAWSIDEFENVDTSGTNGAGAIVQAVTGSSAVNVTSLSITLAAFGEIVNATYGAFGIPLNTAGQPTVGTGFTSLGQRNQGSPNLAMRTEFNAAPDTSVDASWGAASVSPVGIAVEIKHRQMNWASFVDNMNDNSLDATLWGSYANGSTTVAETNQRLQLTLPASATASSNAGIYSKPRVDLTSGAIEIKVDEVTNPATTANSEFSLLLNTTNYVRFVKEGANLYMQRIIAGVTTNISGSIAWNAAAHKYLRFRENAGVIYWEHSYNAITWFEICNWTSTIDVTLFEVQLNIFAYEAVSNGGNFYVDGVNSQTDDPLTDAHTLTDAFPNGAYDAGKWVNYNGAAIVGNVSRFQGTMASAYHGLISNLKYNFLNSYSLCEVVTAGNQALSSWELYPLQVVLSSANKLAFIITGGTIIARSTVNSVTVTNTSATYNSTTHKWLRIRETSGTVYWEYSSDGITWNTLVSAATPFALDTVGLEPTAGNWAAEASATYAEIDNWNLPPTTGQHFFF